MKKSLLVRIIAIWSLIRLAWSTYMAISGFRWLLHHSDPGPLTVVNLSPKALFTASALPLQAAITTFAAMTYGKSAEVTANGLAAIAYGAVAVGLWIKGERARNVAGWVYGVETVLLAFYLIFVLPTLALPWPEYKTFGTASLVTFIAAYAATSTYLLFPTSKKFLLGGTSAWRTLPRE